MALKEPLKLNYIDCLRGVAILMVILIHTSNAIDGLSSYSYWPTKYGQMGVQLFFVLSAYTLCLSMTRRGGEKNPTLNFFIRRYFRIAPLYYLGLLIYFIYSFYNNLYHHNILEADSRYNFSNIIANVLFVHGFYPPATNNIVPGGWSIGAEMAFYAIFPLLFIVVNKMVAVSKVYIFLLPFLCCLCCWFIIRMMSQSLSMPLTNNTFLYFNIINQLPVFILGMSYFFYERSIDTIRVISHTKNVLLFIVLTIIPILAFMFFYDITFVPFISGLSFIFLMRIFSSVDILNFKFLRRIGQLSFSMYIFHFLFAGILTDYLFLKLQAILPEAVLLFCFVLNVVLTFFIASITEKLIEKRGINLGKYLIIRFERSATVSKSSYKYGE